MNLETESAVLAAPAFVSLTRLQMTPIPELVAVRVDRSFQVISRMVWCPLAQFDIASLPRAFVPRLLKFSFALDVSSSRDTLAENSLSRDAEFTAAGSVSKTDPFASLLSSAVPVSCICTSSAFRPRFFRPSASSLESVSRVNFLYANLVLLISCVYGIHCSIVGCHSVSFGIHTIRAVLHPKMNPRFSSVLVPRLNRVTSQSKTTCQSPLHQADDVPSSCTNSLVVDYWLDLSSLRYKPVPAALREVAVSAVVNNSSASSGPGTSLRARSAHPLTSRRSAEHSTCSTSLAL